MERLEDKNRLDEALTEAIGSEESKVNFEKWRQGHPEAVEMLTSRADKGRSTSTRPFSIRRIIMKSPITKLAAAAAVLIIVVSFGIHFFVGSGASVALGEVKVAMEKIDWMHLTSESTSLEGWFAFESKVIIEKQEDGTISYIDSGQNKQFLYDPGTETIKILRIVPDEVFAAGFEYPFFKRYDNPFEFLADTAKLIQAEGGKFKQSTGEYEGTKVVIWEISHKDTGFDCINIDSKIKEVDPEDYGVEMIRMFIDPERHLPLGTANKFVKNGKLVYETHTKLEYPEFGPKDIYDLGVPKSATIVDKTQ